MLRQIPEFLPFEVDVALELCDAYLDSGDGSGYHVFVAEVAGQVEGYICYGPTPVTDGTWDVYWMAVAPEMQSKGVGGQLMAFAIGKIEEAGGRLAVIETSSKPEYERILRFHISHGFDVVCRVPDFYAVGDDKLILVRRLT
jgi:GNAT superfamily N-acetyltransferase